MDGLKVFGNRLDRHLNGTSGSDEGLIDDGVGSARKRDDRSGGAEGVRESVSLRMFESLGGGSVSTSVHTEGLEELFTEKLGDSLSGDLLSDGGGDGVTQVEIFVFVSQRRNRRESFMNTFGDISRDVEEPEEVVLPEWCQFCCW